MSGQSHIEREITELRARAAARDFTGRSLGTAMAGVDRQLKRDSKRLGGAGEAWMTVCPAELIARTAITGLNRGELRVAVADSATMYTLDRYLRAGGEAELARASTAPIYRVRLALDARPFTHANAQGTLT